MNAPPLNASSHTKITYYLFLCNQVMQALPFVEAEVTASHENGRRCTEINDRKTITNVSDGNRSGCYPINPKVEAEVTASHENGRRCTEINKGKSTLVEGISAASNGDMEKRGFQHVYRTSKMPSSLRVQAAFMTTMVNGAPQTKNAIKRHAKKRKKLLGLKEVLCSPKHSMDSTILESMSVFFSGTGVRSIPNHSLQSIIYSATKDLQVIDTTEGAKLELTNTDTIFILIPRNDAI